MLTGELLEAPLPDTFGRSIRTSVLIRSLLRAAPFADTVASSSLMMDLWAAESFVDARDLSSRFAILWGDGRPTPEKKESLQRLRRNAEAINREMLAYMYLEEEDASGSSIPLGRLEASQRSLYGVTCFWVAFQHCTELAEKTMRIKEKDKSKKVSREIKAKETICLKNCFVVLNPFPDSSRQHYLDYFRSDVLNAAKLRENAAGFFSWDDQRVFGEPLKNQLAVLSTCIASSDMVNEKSSRSLCEKHRRTTSECKIPCAAVDNLFIEHQKQCRHNAIVGVTVLLGFLASAMFANQALAAASAIFAPLVFSAAAFWKHSRTAPIAPPASAAHSPQA